MILHPVPITAHLPVFIRPTTLKTIQVFRVFPSYHSDVRFVFWPGHLNQPLCEMRKVFPVQSMAYNTQSAIVRRVFALGCEADANRKSRLLAREGGLEDIKKMNSVLRFVVVFPL